MLKLGCLVLLTFTLTWLSVEASAIRVEPKSRTMEKELSDAVHDLNGKHNAEYDHEAFLGREEAHAFDELTPDESKTRLALIVDKLDTNKDSFVSEAEMIAWIKYIQKRFVTEDGKRQWGYFGKSDSDTMTWLEYTNRTYGYLDENDAASDGVKFKDLMDRDNRRFLRADANQDGKLSFSEYIDFLHPEEAPHMKDIVVTETLEDIDKNKDGFIDEAEYVGDMWQNAGQEAEPDWLASERQHFSAWRDLNKDGRMDKEEVKHWIMPDDYDHAEAESKHLIYEADADKDGRLTKKEILDKYDLFAGSQATDYGEALKVTHDEF